MIFISCAWEDSAAFERATELNEELLGQGIRTVFDESRVQGDPDETLRTDIDACDLVLVLVTREYVGQLNSPSTSPEPGARMCWCRREWNYARLSKDAGGVVLAVMEPEMLSDEFADTLRALAGEGGGQCVLDFTQDVDVDEVVAAYEQRSANIAAGRAVRAKRGPSFVEAPMDWDKTQRTLYYPSGDRKYVGSVLWNQMHGQGTYFFKNGDRYEGEFAEDFFSGRGVLRFRDGSTFEGGFRFDKRSGFGRSFRPDGSLKFQGEYSNGLRSGAGTECDENGEPVREGVWRDGDLVSVADDPRAPEEGPEKGAGTRPGFPRASKSDMSLGSGESHREHRGSSGGAAAKPKRAGLMHRAVQRLSMSRRKSVARSGAARGSSVESAAGAGEEEDAEALDEVVRSGRSSVTTVRRQQGSQRARFGKYKFDT